MTMRRPVLGLTLLLATQVAMARTRAVVSPSPLRDIALSRELAVSDIDYVPGNGYLDFSPRIAVAPEQELVVWHGKAVRLDVNGLPLDRTPILLPIDARAVAWDGSRYIAIGLADARIDSVEITTDGTVGPVKRGVVKLPGRNIFWLEIAITPHDTLISYYFEGFDGTATTFVVSARNGTMWKSTGWSFTSRFRLIRGDGDLVLVLGSLGNSALIDGSRVTPVALAAENGTWTGSDFLAVSESSTGIVANHVSRDAVVFPPFLVHASKAASLAPSVACADGACRIVWKERRVAGFDRNLVITAFDLYSTTTVNDVAAPAEKFDTDNDRVVGSEGVIDWPWIAVEHGSAVIVWSRGLVSDLYSRVFYAARLPFATPAKPQPVLISGRARAQSSATLTTAPSGVRVWWPDGAQQRSTEIDPTGQRSSDLTGDTLDPKASSDHLIVASRADNEVVVLDADSGATMRTFTLPFRVDSAACARNDCLGISTHAIVRFTTGGNVIGNPLTVTPGLNVLAVAARGDDYLLAFSDLALGARVGRFFSDNRISNLTPIPSGVFLALVGSETSWLVATQDGEFTKTFLVDDANVNAGAQFKATFPHFAWDGRNWIAVWSTDVKDIVGARLSSDARTVDATFAVAATDYDETLGDVKSIGNGRTAVAYVRRATEQLYGGVNRVFIRWIENSR